MEVDDGKNEWFEVGTIKRNTKRSWFEYGLVLGKMNNEGDEVYEKGLQ